MLLARLIWLLVMLAAALSNASEEADMFIEYKVRPVTRYVITRFIETNDSVLGKGARRSQALGTYDSLRDANFVATKMADDDRYLVMGMSDGSQVVFNPLHIPGEVS